MYVKLAFKNVKKSLRDYTIYFITLMFGVCIFYMFNAIESQTVMMKLSQTQNGIIRNLTFLIQYLSIFVAVILGFLILYANKFLVKRRQKELGMYMLLGMDKWKISFVLILETFSIGICSLVSGLLSGIFLSQGLSVLTAKLFEADMTVFSFVFSKGACLKTLLYFGIIYGIVIVFNVIILSRCKLIHLIYGNQQNESPKIRNIRFSVNLFILAIVCLGLGYYCIIKNGLLTIDAKFYGAFIFTAIGTIFFFMSLAGFFLKIIQSSKKRYYKDLNVFVLKQINSKINTNNISMIIICLLLAVTIVSLSSGIAVRGSMSKELEATTPYDVSFIWEQGQSGKEVGNLEKRLAEGGIRLEEYTETFANYSFYETSVTAQTVLEDQLLEGSARYLQELATREFNAMTVSDYNKVAVLQGKEKLILGEGEFAVVCDYQEMIPFWHTYLSKEPEIRYNSKILKSAHHSAIDMTLNNKLSRNNPGVIIVSDDIIDETKKVRDILSFNYKLPQQDELLCNEVLSQEVERQVTELATKEIELYTENRIYDASIGFSAIVVYLTMYIAIVFLMTSAAVLALQQLTEAEDNKKRYELLGKLGADEKMIHKALFKQIGIYFIVPLSLALVHSMVGIYVANNVIRILGDVDLFKSIFVTACIFVVIYGGYFVATYYSSKSLIRK